ncbi:hypothetical protein AAFO92_14420 [Roseovarius sp. CAU 1744]|uniref:hypothetical protein n=1 Tax=Roseovarius sp. CAU 1744 TaxID=3140368 RepID=UPI00325B9519
MTAYNPNFELSVADVDLIERALRLTKAELSSQLIGSGAQTSEGGDTAPEVNETLRQIHDLLGRLHGQKVFYRPRAGAYIGG